MSDIAIVQTDDLIFDFEIESGELVLDEGLETAIIISLFSNARALTDEIPFGVTDPEGWWGDQFAETQGDKIGSKLWTLAREKRTEETLTRATEYTKEALQWLIDDEVAQTVDVECEYTEEGFLAINVDITRLSGDQENFRFYEQWQGQLAKGE